jgi:hypothetical protein
MYRLLAALHRNENLETLLDRKRVSHPQIFDTLELDMLEKGRTHSPRKGRTAKAAIATAKQAHSHIHHSPQQLRA